MKPLPDPMIYRSHLYVWNHGVLWLHDIENCWCKGLVDCEQEL